MNKKVLVPKSKNTINNKLQKGYFDLNEISGLSIFISYFWRGFNLNIHVLKKKYYVWFVQKIALKT